MEYQALYRQFRPSVFSDMIGQEHIVTALINQIKNNKLAHAYLFCGTRGTGKTTAARILSKAINCEHLKDGEPCNECESCRSIIDGSTVDVTEIDAASNTGVDNIRQIREEVSYPPVLLNYKVYIIDEVHMLSEGAFNALLKTLEEPPEHVVFILATTEYHKIPATILSRCQRFDFKRITSGEIIKRLKFVCDSSSVSVDDEALALIAYAADGSMRDGLSILDKCISFNPENITSESVSKILGIVDDTDIFKISEFLSKKDLKNIISLTERTISDGRDPILFTSYLIEHFRCLMVASLVDKCDEILQMSKERSEKFSNHSKLFKTGEIVSLLKKLNQIYKLQKESPNPKVMLEVGLAELCDDVVIQANNIKPKTVINEFIPTEPKPHVDEPVKETETNEVTEIKSKINSDTQDIRKIWTEVIDSLKNSGKFMLASSVVLAYPVDKGNVIDIVFKSANKANKEMIDNPDNIKTIQDAFYDISARDVKVNFVIQGKAVKEESPAPNNVMNLAKQFPDLVSVDESEE